jgi:hypothetical protein
MPESRVLFRRPIWFLQILKMNDFAWFRLSPANSFSTSRLNCSFGIFPKGFGGALAKPSKQDEGIVEKLEAVLGDDALLLLSDQDQGGMLPRQRHAYANAGQFVVQVDLRVGRAFRGDHIQDRIL